MLHACNLIATSALGLLSHEHGAHMKCYFDIKMHILSIFYDDL